METLTVETIKFTEMNLKINLPITYTNYSLCMEGVVMQDNILVMLKLVLWTYTKQIYSS